MENRVITTTRVYISGSQEFCLQWLRCSFHAEDLHGFCDHGAGVYLSIDAHQESFVQQYVCMFYWGGGGGKEKKKNM